jgi:hypothetical protein
MTGLGGMTGDSTRPGTGLPPQPPASVRFEVRSAGKDPDSKMVFLNSAKDHKKAGNFVVVLSPEVAVKFKAAGIAAPEKHYLGKTVVVYGTVTKFKSFAQIRVFGPENIKVAGAE